MAEETEAGRHSQDAVDEVILKAVHVLAEKLPNLINAGGLSTYDERLSVSEDSASFCSSVSRSISELEDFRLKLQEDARLSEIYKLRHNLSERYDNRSYIHPHGTTNFDYKAIAENRKEGFEKFKLRVRQENYKYLGSHPEIRAMISLFIKKLLSTQPADPVQYLAEFFTTRLAEGTDFKEVLQSEIRKISRYRVNKMKGAGLISLLPSSLIRDESSEDPQAPEADINFEKRLNIGPLAKDFYFDGNRPKKKPPPPEPPKPKKPKKCKICPKQCICVKGKGMRRVDYEASLKRAAEKAEEEAKARTSESPRKTHFDSEGEFEDNPAVIEQELYHDIVQDVFDGDFVNEHE